MCGRYALNLRPSQIRRILEQDNMDAEDAPDDDCEGAPRQTYNFAPGNRGVVYRADVTDRGAGDGINNTAFCTVTGTSREQARKYEDPARIKYRIQAMEWGLIPFWTKRDPGYSTLSKTINCRDDSLARPGGMWCSMKAGKRCIVIAQGFYEWLKKGKDKVPYFVKRRDGRLMCFAGLWDCVELEGAAEKRYTYTIITTDSNEQLKFLHDRMPVIFEPGSEDLWKWLDPRRHEWSQELQHILRPTSEELDCYPVTQDVNKVGNNSPTFVIPVASKENKHNIANFFQNRSAEQTHGRDNIGSLVKAIDGEKHLPGHQAVPAPAASTEISKGEFNKSVKRAASEDCSSIHGVKRMRPSSPGKMSATSNTKKSPTKVESNSIQKITKFFPTI